MALEAEKPERKPGYRKRSLVRHLVVLCLIGILLLLLNVLHIYPRVIEVTVAIAGACGWAYVVAMEGR